MSLYNWNNTVATRTISIISKYGYVKWHLVGYWLQVTGYWFTGYWLLVTGLLVTGYWLLVYWLLVVGLSVVLGFSISHLNQNFITCIVNCRARRRRGAGNLYGKREFLQSHFLSFYFYLLS